MDRRMKPCAECGHGKSKHLTHGCRHTWRRRGQTCLILTAIGGGK